MLRKPKALPRQGTIGIAAPAGPVEAEQLAAGEAWLCEQGFSVVRRDDMVARRGYLAGDDARRAKELLELVRDDRVGAIFCARGGYGSPRILKELDADAFHQAAKPLVGFSDATAILLWQQRCAELVGFHGPMLAPNPCPSEEWSELIAVLTGEAQPAPLRGTPRGGGRAEGVLVGGSLSLLVASLGSRWEPDTRGAILMLEEVGEKPYRIDRTLQQLAAAGKLDGVVGVGVGSLVCCEDERYPSPTALEVVEEFVQPFGIPFVVDLPFGHEEPNKVWPLGARAAIDGDAGEVRVLEEVVQA